MAIHLKDKNFRLNSMLLFSFIALFVIFMMSLMAFQFNREKRLNVYDIERRAGISNDILRAYLDVTNADFLELPYFVESMSDTTIRVAILDSICGVLYDNYKPAEKHMLNDLIEYIPESFGVNLGNVHILSGDSIYTCIERHPKYYICTSLNYDVSAISIWTTNRTYIYFVALLFLSMMLMFYLVLNRFRRKVKENENILKKEITQNISHELKTPLAGILGYIESIMENKDLSSEKVYYFLGKTHVQAKRLQGLLDDIAVLNKIDERSQMYEFDAVNVVEVIDEVVDDVNDAMFEKNITYSINITDDVNIIGNRSLIYSIFRNLFDNVVAYAGEDVMIDVKLTNEDKRFYYFEFRDNGVGTDKKHLNRLFERFYRADKGRSRKSGGTGLGLAIVKNAILLHNGDISVDNADGGGLLFNFSIRKM